jgi:hypothetical protein
MPPFCVSIVFLEASFRLLIPAYSIMIAKSRPAFASLPA